jgi:hypothetical protein
VRRIVSLCALAVPAALLVACGGDNSSSSSATTTATTTATTAAAATTAASATTAAAATTAAPATTAAGSTTSAAGGGAQSLQCKPVGDIGSAATKLSYTLTDFKFDGPATAKAGQVGFALDNTGQAPHELEIIKADSFDALPKDAAGGVDENALAAGAKVGEVARFQAGTDCSGVFNLAAGNYVLVCNIEFKNGPTTVSHAAKGMHLDLQVTA